MLSLFELEKKKTFITSRPDVVQTGHNTDIGQV